MNFGSIGKLLEATVKYCDLNVDNVSSNFESVKLDLNYGSANIEMQPNVSYKLDGFVSFGSINYPSNSKVNKNSERNEIKYTGTVGSGNDPKATVKIDSKFGSVDLK